MDKLQGSCSCGQWQVRIKVGKPISELIPRICDCDYCKSNPSAIVSDPSMKIELDGGKAIFDQNGDRQAKFYRCEKCNELLAVGCIIEGKLRGAVNSNLFCDTYAFSDPLQIQPWKLTSIQRMERWSKLWGLLSGV